eukprot:CAMPEP_0180548220 /NCGR_PEP_ID=MMETSP1036_2-20121128/71501_1 /TAXON_ID=632150 /ORGANISM="Azadinium spinosum, Strain 3D9" /LENGTH=88 /DNA_ID=CAMNT_0022563403 /DNA_START=59 /DNA_END=325 /DNA_ORIENTATION=-
MITPSFHFTLKPLLRPDVLSLEDCLVFALSMSPAARRPCQVARPHGEVELPIRLIEHPHLHLQLSALGALQLVPDLSCGETVSNFIRL